MTDVPLDAVLKDVKQALELVRLKRSPTPEECVLSIGAERLEDERMRLEDELEQVKRVWYLEAQVYRRNVARLEEVERVVAHYKQALERIAVLENAPGNYIPACPWCHGVEGSHTFPNCPGHTARLALDAVIVASKHDCPDCGSRLIVKPRSFFFKGRTFTGLSCEKCHTVMDNPEDSFEAFVRDGN